MPPRKVALLFLFTFVAVVVIVLVIAGAPWWAVFGFALLAGMEYSNQMQITAARIEAAGRP
jgi:hypothetical protein